MPYSLRKILPTPTPAVAATAFIIASLFAADAAQGLPDDVKVETYVDGLRFPVSMAPTPGGDILVTEKGLSGDDSPDFPGTVRLIEDGELVDEPLVDFEVKTEGEAGMLGIELMPDFEDSREFLVTYTPLEDQDHLYLSMFRWTDDRTAEPIRDPWIKLPSRPGARRHFGGNVQTTDEHLFVSLSDVTIKSHPQNTGTLHGSILRYNLDGSIPRNNPLGPNNPIYAWGLRNCFDLDFDGEGRLFCGENGPSRHDSVNRIQRGHNYGWPAMYGFCDHHPVLERCKDEGFTEPVYEFPFRVGPTGILMYEGAMFPEWRGDIFLGGWHTGEVHHLKPSEGKEGRFRSTEGPFFVLPSNPYELRNDAERQHLDQYGVTDVAEAPDGAILVLESGAKRGRIFRIAPDEEILDRGAVTEIGDRRLKNNVPEQYSCSQPGSSAPPPTAMMLLFILGALGLSQLRRRLLGLVLPAVLGVAVFVASMGTARAESPSWRYGPQVGIGASTPSGDNIQNGHFAPGAAISGVLRLALIPQFGAQASLGYVQKGSGLNRTDDRLNLHYLALPVTLFGRLPLGESALRLHAGVSNNLLLSASISGSERFTDQLRRHEFSILGGVGLELPVRLPFDVTLDARYERGITQLHDPDALPSYLPVRDRAWNNTIYVLTGLLF